MVDLIDTTWLKKNKGKVIGTSFGLLSGIVFLLFGFWKMFWFVLFIGIGFLIGYQVDRETDLKELLDSILLEKWMRK